MDKIRYIMLWIAAMVIAAFGLLIGYTVGHEGGAKGAKGGDEAEAKTEAGEVTAKVKTAIAREAAMENTLSAFGTVVATPEDTTTISVAFECRVRRVLAAVGQTVEAQTELIEIEPSPDSLMQLADARSTRDAAAKDLASVQQRMEMKLATVSELQTAEQALRLAESKLGSLEKRGIAARRVAGGQAGLVCKIDVQEGQIVPTAGPLVEVVPTDRVQVKLGVEAADVASIKADQGVHIRNVQSPDGNLQVTGKVRLVTGRVNPASRLVDVFVSLPQGSGLLLESYVQGRIVIGTETSLAVPRSAVLSDEQGPYLFVVRDEKAARVGVKTGRENEQDIQILQGELKAGDEVVTEGNYELTDGMAVDDGDEDEDKDDDKDKAAETQGAEGKAPAGKVAASQPAQGQPAQNKPSENHPAKGDE